MRELQMRLADLAPVAEAACAVHEHGGRSVRARADAPIAACASLTTTSRVQPPAADVPAGVGVKRAIPVNLARPFTRPSTVYTFTGLSDGEQHLAIRLGEPDPDCRPLVRMHSECLLGDVFGSRRCDCGPQLEEAVERLSDVGGWLLYLRQEGRGIGLYNKLEAYALQDTGLNTFEANVHLGFPADARDYRVAAEMLSALHIPSVDLLTNNPEKVGQLRAYGIDVGAVVPTGTFENTNNHRYLQAKAEHAHHTLFGDAA